VPGGFRKSALNVDHVFALLLHVHQGAQRIRLEREKTPPRLQPWQDNAALPPSLSPSSSFSSEQPIPFPPLTAVDTCHRDSLPHPPREMVSESDSDIDWFALWCRAFEDVIPKRFKWTEGELRNNRCSKVAAKSEPNLHESESVY
jgi:hypothetical protein